MLIPTFGHTMKGCIQSQGNAGPPIFRGGTQLTENLPAFRDIFFEGYIQRLMLLQPHMT